MTDAQGELLAWYDAHRRVLPWREEPTPYRVWVSELMLQQTQVATVLPFFARWMERFPDVESLAAASEDEVLAAWQGLGYYRRARALLEGARQIVRDGWPQNTEEWRRVQGVGPYTAGAIASIALGQPEPLVDGNVNRVYSRVEADPTPLPGLEKRAWAWAGANLARERPGDYNQALMELGATVCRPVDPVCPACPWQKRCQAHLAGDPGLYPAPAARPAWREVEHWLWIPRQESRVGLRRIPTGEWWAGMWTFALARDVAELEREFPGAWPQDVGTFRHAVTVHRVTLRVAVVRGEGDWTWVTPEELEGYAVPAPHKKAYGAARKMGLV